MPRGTRRLIVGVLAAVGLTLRLWNAATATLHEDERHYVSDAYWATSPLATGEALRFLREHPREHLRLDPDTGARVPWGTPGTELRTGHPCLFAYVTGAVLAVTRPRSAASAVRTGRVLNALADASVVLLLPGLTDALGATPGAAVLAAGAYAAFPPAVTYGSLAYLDAFLAPLMVVLATILARPQQGLRRWVALGIATGLLASAKQTGLVAFVLVPVATLLLGPRSLGGLAAWVVTSVAVIAAFTDPVAYAVALLHPRTAAATIGVQPLARLAANVGWLADPAGYYWLSFSRHAEPLAPAVARLHYVLTPAYVTLFAAAILGALAGRAGASLLLLAAPVVALLALVVPTDAAWRLHMGSPLLCALLACRLPALPRAARLAALGVALLAASHVSWPAHPDAGGALDLGDLLFWNPSARQIPGFYSPRRFPPRPPLSIRGPVELGRRVRLAPGRWRIAVTGTGLLGVALDGRTLVAAGGRAADVVLEGRLHRLAVTVPQGGRLVRLAFLPLVPVGS